MQHEKPELIIDTKELPRVTVNFAQSPSQVCDEGIEKTLPRVWEMPVSDAVSCVNDKGKKVMNA